MPDNLTPEQRSYCMSRIKGKDTGIETSVRSELHRRGLRFRKHVKDLLPVPHMGTQGLGFLENEDIQDSRKGHQEPPTAP